MGQVVTELVIDADTSGADRFSSSMDKAAGSAASTVLAIAGVGAAFIGVMASLRGFVDYVGGVNKALIDLQDHADLAGLSTKEFQQTLFAARSAGLTEKDFVAGLDKIGADLTAASRGVTEFSKLFSANGLSIRDINGQLISTKTALNDIAGLMQHATPQVQQALAGIVGLSKDWIPFLRQGVDAIEQQKAAALTLGVVIDDATIQKAKDFDRQWRIATATWDTQLKASLTELLPLMVKLAGYAIKVIETVGSISGFFSRSFMTPEQMGLADLSKQIDQAMSLRDKMVDLNGVVDAWETHKLERGMAALGLPDVADLKILDDYIAKLARLYDEKNKPPRVYIGGGTTQLPSIGTDGNDRVDSAINTLRRHTEQQIADTAAIGLGAGALALFRAQAAETSAVLANGGKETAEQAAQFKELQARAYDAAVALERAKVANDISRGRQTALLSQDDVAIANQLKLSYPDVARALDSVEAAAIRNNNALRGVSNVLENNLTTGITDAISGAKSFGQAMSDTSKVVIRAIEEMIVKMLIIQPLMRSLQGAFGGFGGFGGSNATDGIGGFGPTVASANGNVFLNGNVIPFAQGGIIDREMVVPMARMGEAGPEAIVPLRRGPDGNLGVARLGGGSAAVTNVYVYGAPSKPQVSDTPNDSGGRDIRIDFRDAVRGVVLDDIASNGPISRSMPMRAGNQFGGR